MFLYAFQSMVSRTRTKIWSITFVWLATLTSVAQQTDTNSLVSLYQRAREAFSDRQFQKSSGLFRSVAEQCPDSELAIQCEYFATMSEWAIEPCDGCAAKLSSWLGKANKFQDDSIAAGRAMDSKQLIKWIENAELVHAKWDRQKQRFELAEKRLRTFLGTSDADRKLTTDAAADAVPPPALLLVSCAGSAVSLSAVSNDSIARANCPQPPCRWSGFFSRACRIICSKGRGMAALY